MQNRMDALDWNDLRFLLAVADARTLTAAAKRLGVSQPTAGRRLAALEAAVGARLVVRTKNGQSLTPEGTMLRDVAAELARRISGIERGALGGRATAGLVRIAATETSAAQIVDLALGALRAKHPELELELATGNVVADLQAGEVDLAVRLVPPEGGRVIARKLGAQRYAMYGAPAYLAKRRAPSAPEDLGAHAVIFPTRELARGPEAAWLGRVAAGAEIALRTNSMPIVVRAAAAAHGLGVLPEPVGDANPSLRRVLELPRTIARDVYLVQHEEARTIPRIRAAASAVGDAISDLLRRAARRA